ncbi:MAG: adenylate/guanylate cyclase domain-containing protein [Pseudolabrys sp.]|nr:adenylate/guanylate cyclase domain-containing protein [Pseudolabrys sp.]
MRARKAATAAIRIVAPEVARQPASKADISDRDPAKPAQWASPSTLIRRLAAIMAADVVGYTRLMAEDEERTHLALRSVWRRVIAPCVARHAGRVVKHTGDGFLAEFGSALAAVRCAMTFQCLVRARCGGDRGLLFRVGVHLGDVIVEPHDIFGHSVNLACRLQSLAEPGGVLLSEAVYAAVRASLPVPVEATGEHVLRHEAISVRTFRIGLH